jgi:RHH-type proline utilization regulon transcriptional repressor/proline dehydrogenase/delta 1-pyrroline-5-carboxylate dehydrogenase
MAIRTGCRVAAAHRAASCRSQAAAAVAIAGEAVGAPLVADPRIGGIAVTGSTETARQINLALARRPGPIVPLMPRPAGRMR